MRVQGYRPTYRQSADAAFQLDPQQVDLSSTQGQTRGMLELVEELTRWRQGDRTTRSQVRWHPETMPLTVYLSEADRATEKLLDSVLKDWEAASMGQVCFQRVPMNGAADIVFRWSETPVEGRDFEVGHTHRSVTGSREDSGLIRHAEIILLREPAIDCRLNDGQRLRRLRATLLHEVGHALGLEHSTNPADVMHHRGWKNAFLSDNDCRAIQALYRTFNNRA